MILSSPWAKPCTTSDDKGLDFFGFPREIRDMVYAEIFVKPTRIGAESKFTKPFWREAISWRNHNLAGTCRQIWNESLQVYLLKNGFEFFYVRPFLEFLEKIGIRGRRLLRDIVWHHHAHSIPFIAIRYLKSCTKLQNLQVFARVTVKDRKGLRYLVPFINARQFFIGDNHTIAFDSALPSSKSAEVDAVVPELRSKNLKGDYNDRSLQTLSKSLRKFKWELTGKYERYVDVCINVIFCLEANTRVSRDLPNIHTNGIVH